MSTARKNPDHIQTVDVSKHRNLRVKLDPGYNHASQQHLAPVTLMELAACAGDYPLAFIQRPADGSFMVVAMLGLRSGENTFHNKDGWESNYVPLSVQRDPFIIGYDDRRPEGNDITTCLDRNSTALSESDGIALFTAAGEETDFLKSRHQMLGSIFESQKLTDAFCQTIKELGLIVPLNLQLRMETGEVRGLSGLHAIDEIKLKQLSAEQLKSLHDRDFLAACFITLVSLHQMKRLIRLRNQKGGEQITNFQIDFNASAQQAPAQPTAAAQ